MTIVKHLIPVRSITGLIALVVLWAEFPLLGFIRRSVFEAQHLVSDLLPVLLTGFWGWVLLFASWVCEKEGKLTLSRMTFGLAIINFLFAVLSVADIALNGNSTSGIAFLTYPVLSALVVIPLCLIMIVVDLLLSRRIEA